MRSIHMSLIFTTSDSTCSWWLPSSPDSQKWLGKNDLSPVSHKTRGPFLGIPFNLSATPSTSLIFKALYFVDSRPLWFPSFYPPSLLPWLLNSMRFSKTFSSVDWPAFPAPLSFLVTPFIIWDFRYSSMWITHIISKAQRGSWKGHVHELKW